MINIKKILMNKYQINKINLISLKLIIKTFNKIF